MGMSCPLWAISEHNGVQSGRLSGCSARDGTDVRPSRFNIGTRYGHGQHEYCRPIPVPEVPVVPRAAFPRSSPYSLAGNQSLAFCVAQPGREYVKRQWGFPNEYEGSLYHYLTRAAEFHARSRNEYDGKARREYEDLARQYLRLAKQAEAMSSRTEFTSRRPRSGVNRS